MPDVQGGGHAVDVNELVSPRLSPKEIGTMMRPLEFDLQAAFAAMRDEMIDELHKSVERGDTPQDFIMRIDDMIGRKETEESLVEKDWPNARPVEELPPTEDVKVQELAPAGDGSRVFLVDDEAVLSLFDTDWAGGGNHEAKPYIPEGEIWVGAMIPEEERAQYTTHEATEETLMEQGQDYDSAHNVANLPEAVQRFEEIFSAALKVDLFPIRVMCAMSGLDVVIKESWANWAIGETRIMNGSLVIRIKKQTNKWSDYKKLGKAPAGWKNGDPVPEHMKPLEVEPVNPDQPEAAPGNKEFYGHDPDKFKDEFAEWLSIKYPDPVNGFPTKAEAKEFLDKKSVDSLLQYAEDHHYKAGWKPGGQGEQDLHPSAEPKEPGDKDDADQMALLSENEDAFGENEALYKNHLASWMVMYEIDGGNGKFDNPQEAKMFLDKMDGQEMTSFAASSGFNPGKANEPPKGKDTEEKKPPTLAVQAGLKEALGEFEKPEKLPTIESETDLGGTTGAKKIIFEHKAGGKYTGVMKGGASEAHAMEEHQANLLYTVMGVKVPAGHVYEKDGKKVMVNAWVDGAMKWDELTASEKSEAKKQLRSNFVADAFLGNWDVTGAAMDNVLWDMNAKQIVRIDNGGALRFRAQGAEKGDQFGPIVEELKTMRDPTKLAGKLVYSEVSDSEVQEQIKKIVANKQFILDACHDNDLAKIMAGRIKYLKGWTPAKTAKPAAPSAAKPAAPAAPPAHKMGVVVIKKPHGKVLGMDFPDVRDKHCKAFKSYQGSSNELNRILRSYEDPDAKNKAQIEALDDYYKDVPEWDVETQLGQPLYRGVGPKYLKKFFAGFGFPKFDIGFDELGKKTPAGKKTWEEAITDALTGATFYDQGYMGTSANFDKAHGFGGDSRIGHEGASVVFVVTGKARGVEAEAVGQGGFVNEQEILFQRGTGWNIKGVSFKKQKGDKGYIELRVTPKESLVHA